MNAFLTKASKILPFAAVLIFFGYMIYAFFFPPMTIRYRIAIDVTVDGVPHAGASVVEFSYNIRTNRYYRLPANWADGTMNGYAPAVDLGRYGILFIVQSASLRSNDGSNLIEDTSGGNGPTLGSLPFQVIGATIHISNDAMRLFPEVFAQTREVILRPSDLPMVVLLERPDQTTFRAVDPTNLEKDIAPGVHLDRVTYQITDAPITAAPAEWPGWLKESRNLRVPLIARTPGRHDITYADFHGPNN